jgi:hypothetical protein
MRNIAIDSAGERRSAFPALPHAPTAESLPAPPVIVTPA